MAATKQSAKSPWDDLKMTVRKACMIKSEGDDSAAIQILKKELPLKLGPWARTAKLDGKGKKAVLKDLFQSELDRAEDIKQQKEAITAEIEKRLDGHFQDEFQRLKEAISKKLPGLKLSEFEHRPLRTKDADDLLSGNKGSNTQKSNASSHKQDGRFSLPPKPSVPRRQGGIPFDDLESILNAAIDRCGA